MLHVISIQWNMSYLDYTACTLTQQVVSSTAMLILLYNVPFYRAHHQWVGNHDMVIGQHILAHGLVCCHRSGFCFQTDMLHN